jgi:hypothetical protein
MKHLETILAWLVLGAAGAGLGILLVCWLTGSEPAPGQVQCIECVNNLDPVPQGYYDNMRGD